MKFLLLIILCFTSAYYSFGQFNFVADNSSSPFLNNQLKKTELRAPNFDSLSFELRFWVSGEFGGFIQLTFNKDAKWNVRRGFIDKNSKIQSFETKLEQLEIESIWEKLLSNNVLDLPNQDELVYTYQKDGRTIKIGPEKEETESIIHNTLDGSLYTIELFKKEKYRNYYYYNPFTLNEHFQNSGWSSMETKKFANIANTLLESFYMNEVFKANLIEKLGKD